MELLAANLSLRAQRWTELYEDWGGPQHQQEPCFQDEKLLEDVMDLMLRQRSRKKQS
jgi:hypothetical protein